GVCGLIVPDQPAEESAEFDDALAPAGLLRIDLYAPTTPDARLARLVPRSRGFVYCVSLTGVTGARSALATDVADFVGRVRRHTALPVAVGFGISRPEHVAALRGVADGVIVGSAALVGGRAAHLRARDPRPGGTGELRAGPHLVEHCEDTEGGASRLSAWRACPPSGVGARPPRRSAARGALVLVVMKRGATQPEI